MNPGCGSRAEYGKTSVWSWRSRSSNATGLFRRRRGEPLSRRGREAVGQHALFAQRREMLGDGIGDLAAEPLHGRVIEIEWRAGCGGHGARSMTGDETAVNCSDGWSRNPP